MSNDLISRKALMEKAKDYFISPDGALRLIENQPTAYDADKVVEEMKKVEKETLGKTEEFYKNLNISPQAIFAASNSFLVMLRKCIEIVKSGGVADD